jgi:hypothetical protein
MFWVSIGSHRASVQASVTNNLADELSGTRGEPPLLEGRRARVRMVARPDTEAGLVTSNSDGRR